MGYMSRTEQLQRINGEIFYPFYCFTTLAHEGVFRKKISSDNLMADTFFYIQRRGNVETQGGNAKKNPFHPKYYPHSNYLSKDLIIAQECQRLLCIQGICDFRKFCSSATGEKGDRT